MLNRQKVKKGYEKRIKILGRIAGQPYLVGRPNYSTVDNTPAVIRTKVPFKVDTGAKKYLNIGLMRVPVFEVFGPRHFIKEGDVLIKGTFTSPSIAYPTSTVLYYEDAGSMVALRTTRRGHIALSQSEDTGLYTYLYQNILFDIYSEGYQTGQITRDFAGEGTPIPATRFVLYVRQGLVTANYLGLTILETDNNGVLNGHKWTIEQADWSGPLMVCSVRRMTN